ncbi:cytochrome P450 [Streptomyces boninensis]|uniref:cytochrome P450 n=1 Tax=Streptomyces boninensis TaxID=2039455 RepID=UPI003B21236D
MTHDLPAVLGGFDLTDQARYAAGVPYDVLARLRREAPVLFHPPGRMPDGEGFWVLTRHGDIAAAAADPAFSAQGGGGRKGGGSHLADLPLGQVAGVLLPMMDNPRHELIKQLLGPAVSAGVAASLEGELRTCAAEVIDKAVARGACDFVTDVTEQFAVRAMALLLGAPRRDWDRLVAWAHDVVGFTDRRAGHPTERSQATLAAMQGYVDGLLAAKTASPAEDLASVVAVGEIPGMSPITPLERSANLGLLLLTGSEQPRNTAAGGLLALAERPDQWHALRTDRTLVPGAVEEMLRWAPPNPYNRRTATRDIELRGKLIRAGDKVTLWWPAANRDEAVFAAPEEFDVRRDPNPHLTFGAGTHYCLGDEVGRLELRVLLEELLDRVAAIRVTGPVGYAPSNKHAVMLEMPVEMVAAAGP